MKLIVRCGILVGLGSFAWILAEYFVGFRTTDFSTHLTTSLFTIAVLIVGIVLAVYYRRSQLGNRFSFRSGFMTGLGISLVAGLVMVFGQYIYLGVIDPGYLERAQDWSAYIQVLNGQTVEQASASTADNAWKYNIHVRALGQVPYFLIQGVVVSAIVSPLAVKRKP